MTPTDREVELYYFDVWEICRMLGRPHPSTVTKLIRTGKVEAVKHRQKWMIAPDQVGVLRGLISHSSFMQTNNDPLILQLNVNYILGICYESSKLRTDRYYDFSRNLWLY